MHRRVSVQIACNSAFQSPCGLNIGNGSAKRARFVAATSANAALAAWNSGSANESAERNESEARVTMISALGAADRSWRRMLEILAAKPVMNPGALA